MDKTNYCNKDVFSDAVMEIRDSMFHVSYAILGNKADCEDAVQETILKAYEKICQLKKPEMFRAWIIRILKNECFMIVRKNKRLITVDTVQSNIEEQEIPDIELNRALRSLKPEFRLTLTLFYVNGYKIHEIGYIMQVSEGTVKSRLSRGRQILREQLNEEINNELLC
ncbi:MAG: RNA polymerase sigma factor [Bacillota bacterium]